MKFLFNVVLETVMSRWSVFIEGQELLTAQKPVIAAHFIWTQQKPRLRILARNLDTGREELFIGRPNPHRMDAVGRRLKESDVEEL